MTARPSKNIEKTSYVTVNYVEQKLSEKQRTIEPANTGSERERNRGPKNGLEKDERYRDEEHDGQDNGFHGGQSVLKLQGKRRLSRGGGF